MNFLSFSYINGQVVSTGAITGDLAATEAQDTIAVSGTVTSVAATITGTLAATEAQDTAAFAGDLAHTGSLVVTEAQDSAALIGKLVHAGVLAATEAQDGFYAIGVSIGVAGGLTVLLRRRRR